MDQSTFDQIIASINSNLTVFQTHGVPITNELIEEKIDEVAAQFLVLPNFELTADDIKLLKFRIGNTFNVRVGEAAITLHNPDLPLWFDSKKTDIEWIHWGAYKSMLKSQGRPQTILDANEEVIDDVLDYSGDPATPGPWARKGLVMGNVQSGKTQNYIGLINKAIDCGYKTIILLGGHLNDLRKQTQERVDEGVLGKKSKHLIDAQRNTPAPIGVGIFHEKTITINSGTTTAGDFNKPFADRLGFKLNGEDPVIFTIKKHTGIMEGLYNWIKDEHYLDPYIGKKLDGPLLLIDDEADYASINTKHHKEEVTKTNDCIRDLLSLFDRNTYVGYTATPFANIFIDPDDSSYSDKDDLFPSDFMIKIPVPDNYLGQDYFFGQKRSCELEEGESIGKSSSPAIPLKDYGPLYELKKTDEIVEIPESLREAVRSFIIAIAIRSLRGESNAHNTMLVNVSHLQVHQNKLELLISNYHEEIDDALDAFAGLGFKSARTNDVLSKLENTFKKVFSVDEDYERVFDKLRWASGKLKVWAINQGSMRKDDRELDYSKHKEYGLCAIVIGGHKLSRGLTLEGLSISYFARNSKAYDTLMQMCRWFGYRPNYKDLCRVYLPVESINWYAFISASIRELYQELDLMSRREQRPSDFGLKVREHPGAMIITAKNKMGVAESEVRSQDLWGQVQRRFRFRESTEVNCRNLEFTKKFVQRIVEERTTTGAIRVDERSQSLIVSDLDYDDIIEYIQKMDLPEDDLGNPALIRHLKKMEKAGLGAPRLVLFNQENLGKPNWMKDLSSSERKFVDNLYPFSTNIQLKLPKRLMDVKSGVYRVKSVHLGNPDDEKLFLSDEERKAVYEEVKHEALSFDFLCSDERDYPGLIIYCFAVAIRPPAGSVDGEKVGLGHGLNPTVGYSISLPRPENLSGKTAGEIRALVKSTKHSYQVNKVHSELQMLSAYEEYEDDE